MLTEKECRNALSDLKNQLQDILGEESCVDECIKTLQKLIDEYFDNPPLEFEELKEGMFVWDNKHHTYIKIDRIWESYNKTIYFYAIGWECCENTEYEPNRFYRKEVQE